MGTENLECFIHFQRLRMAFWSLSLIKGALFFAFHLPSDINLASLDYSLLFHSPFVSWLICSEGRDGCSPLDKKTHNSCLYVHKACLSALVCACVLWEVPCQTKRLKEWTDGRWRRGVYTGRKELGQGSVRSSFSPASVWACGWGTFVLPPLLIIARDRGDVKQMTSLNRRSQWSMSNLWTSRESKEWGRCVFFFLLLWHFYKNDLFPE